MLTLAYKNIKKNKSRRYTPWWKELGYFDQKVTSKKSTWK